MGVTYQLEDRKEVTMYFPTEEEKKLKNTDSEVKLKIPDGGWGWVVVFCSFILCMVADGVSFSFGLLYPEFQHEFNASSSATSWIGSLFVSVPLLTGPIMSALVDCYGCRRMTIVGGIISTLGFILSYFAKSLIVMYATFGIIAGTGLGLIFVTSVVSVTYWFDERRSLAVGLASCGVGMGTFFFAPITLFSISEYGWRGTVLLLSGAFLNMCCCGAAMRDPGWLRQKNQKCAEKLTLEKKKNVATGNDSDDRSSVTSLPILVEASQIKVSTINDLTTNGIEINPAGNNPDGNLEKVVCNRISTLSSKALNTDHGTHAKDVKNIDTPPVPQRKDSSKWIKLEWEVPTSKTNHKLVTVHRNSFVYAGSQDRSLRNRAVSCPNIDYKKNAGSTKGAHQGCYTNTMNLCKSVLDISLFFQLHFLLLSTSTMLLFIWFIVPYFYLVEHLLQNGYLESDGMLLLSIIGFSTTVGMVSLGWAGDQPWANVQKLYGICLILCGVSCGAMIVFTNNYVMLIVSSSVFGFSFASNYSYTPAITVRLVSLDQFTNAYGLLLLSQGIGHLLGPPIAGFLYDLTHSWEPAFWQACIWIIVAGILMLMMPITKDRTLLKTRNKHSIDGT